MLVAHTGHWVVQALYVLPLLAFLVFVVWTTLRERRDRERGRGAPGDEAGPPAARHER